jgi:hypothetical protein
MDGLLSHEALAEQPAIPGEISAVGREELARTHMP